MIPRFDYHSPHERKPISIDAARDRGAGDQRAWGAGAGGRDVCGPGVQHRQPRRRADRESRAFPHDHRRQWRQRGARPGPQAAPAARAGGQGGRLPRRGLRRARPDADAGLDGPRRWWCEQAQRGHRAGQPLPGQDRGRRRRPADDRALRHRRENRGVHRVDPALWNHRAGADRRDRHAAREQRTAPSEQGGACVEDEGQEQGAGD